ncbi:unnamed protein product, partial [Ectocarpus sp. 8 AP-2014]
RERTPPPLRPPRVTGIPSACLASWHHVLRSPRRVQRSGCSLPCCLLRGVCVLTPPLFLPSLCNIFAAISRLLMLLLLMVMLVLVSVAVLLVLLSLSRVLWTDPALRAIANPRAPRREGEADASQEHIKILEN